MDEFQHLKIQLQEIISATNNFDKNNVIGEGGFGKVYKGSLPRYKEGSMVAIKRLDPKHGQGQPEFLKEIVMLSRYQHDNLISLQGFCNEGGESILVYEYASSGSLDRYLSTPDLTWRQRLKICLEAAKALSYLHDPNGNHTRVLHRDIKSSNILLDENFNAKVSDFGLAKIGPADPGNSLLFTGVVGTIGYCDPMYMDEYSLTKESDVYSFGVVLFEVLCGRPCYEYTKNGIEVLVPWWKKSYEKEKLEEIIFPGLRDIRPSSLEAFSDIAYQCLRRSRGERPTMARVVEKLQVAVECHDEELSKDWEKISHYKSMKEQDNMLFSKGIFLNRGKTWFSLNEKGVHCELISSEECMMPITDYKSKYSTEFDSRFAVGCYCLLHEDFFKIHVRPQFLEPQIAYRVNLVCKSYLRNNATSKQLTLCLKYKLEGEDNFRRLSLVHRREDGWFAAELCQFTSNTINFDLEILIKKKDYLAIEGIEFWPLEIVDLQEDDKDVDMQLLVSDSDTQDSAQKLPNDYGEIIKWSKDGVEWTTNKELYFLLRKGFLINNGAEWFSLADNGKKCYMLPTRAALVPGEGWSWLPSPESRFKEVAYCTKLTFDIVCNIKSHLLSPETTYASHIVYKPPKRYTYYQDPLEVYLNGWEMDKWHQGYDRCILLRSPEIPVVTRKGGKNTLEIPKESKMKGMPKRRDDGLMEVQVWEFRTGTTNIEMIPMHLGFQCYQQYHRDFMVEGIEFKPI